MIPATLIVTLGAAAVGMLSGYMIGAQRSGAELAEAQAQYAKHRAAAAEQAARWEADQRAREAARAKTMMETVNAAHRKANAARADAAHLDRVAGVLRAALIDAYASRAGGDTATAGSGTATAGPGLVLPELFGRLDPRLRELAAAADQARTAGLACERAYDTLTSSTDQRGVSLLVRPSRAGTKPSEVPGDAGP